MRARHRRIAAAIVSTALIVIAAACGSKSTNEGGAASTGENVASGAFKVQIQSVSLPTSAGAQPVVTFRASGANDAPVDDLAQRIKNGAVATGQTPTYPWASPPRFTLSVLQAGGDYQSYYTVTATGAPYTLPGATAPTNPTLPSATQATFKAVTAASPEIVAQGNGVYSFTMPALPAGTTVDAGATHTAAVWVTNHPSATDDPESATSTLNFVPNGGAAVEPPLGPDITAGAKGKLAPPGAQRAAANGEEPAAPKA